MLCKLLFIVDVRVKGLFKVTYILHYKKHSVSVAKVDVAHVQQDCAKFQVSVQINEVLLYNKSKKTRNK